MICITTDCTIFECEIEYVLQHIKQSYNVLELGCGYGRVLNRLSPHCNKIVGIDVSQSSLDYAKNKYLDTKYKILNYIELMLITLTNFLNQIHLMSLLVFKMHYLHLGK